MQHRLKSFHWPQAVTFHWCLEVRKYGAISGWTDGVVIRRMWPMKGLMRLSGRRR